MEGQVDKSQYVLPNDQPVVSLDVASAFNGLTQREKLYAHYISKASWEGGLVTLLQTSPESAPIFVLTHKLFSSQSPKDFKENALRQGFTEDEVNAFLVYVCGVLCNMGNYKGFGDTKFVPNLEPARLEALLKTAKIWTEIEPLFIEVKQAIFDLGSGKTCLGYSPVGTTTYLSKNCTAEDNEIVQNWMKANKLECYNTRLFKINNNGKITYEIRVAGEQTKELLKDTVNGITFRLVTGDYSPLMGYCAKYLEQAVQYTENELEANMLKSYVKSFREGSLDEHKNGSRYWIKNKSPAVETYIGFIETYRDPAGVRAEFEGFVAAVNREMSAKFSNLVSEAENFLKLLPWAQGFEKDKFLKPDFTSLDVLTFASSGIPAGINIPNYDEIRQSEGFKNVSLGNVIPASYQMSTTPFLSEADAELLQKYRVQAFELQVGLHELLGHGSGKLLRKNADGTFNFPSDLINPLTGLPVDKYYEPGDTYDSKFGPLSSSYEECRAESVGLYLSLNSDILKIFSHSGSEADDIIYVNWLSLVWAGAGKGLELWEPGRGWLQAHAQARFVISRVLIEAGVAKVTQPSENDLLVTLDRASLKGAGLCAISNFLQKLQVYKATGDVEAAQKMYEHYSEVNEPWLSWRNIVMANKKPRKMFVQANTVIVENDVKLITYEPSFEGLIQSFVERYSDPNGVYQALLELTKKDAVHFL